MSGTPPSPERARRPRPGKDWVDVTRDPVTGIESIRAHFTGHAYDPHFHDAYLVGVTEQGLQEFSCRRALHRSTPGRVILIEPGEIHDGHARDEAGFTYSMLYLTPSWLAETCARAADGRFPAHPVGFSATLHDEPRLAAAIRRAFWRLHAPESRLARDEALDGLAAALNPLIGASVMTRMGEAAARAARRARDLLHERLEQDLGLDELSQRCGADRFQLSRAFRAAYGLPPHAYLVQLRLAAARRRLAAGEAPADVAATVGFADQSHLGRWFRRAFGLTPAAYRAMCTNVPDGQNRLR
ncbi:AraC family transcriptional regulator [Stigmatella aurantiaca]|uniref:Transcriptional regulator, AraC family n=1 Tax=Stigmatella aurantiaca (strain DW4/3-1) TaxID=378806 RepID=Q08NF4_STIAD|nr:AraC family transcriptional regulator [Stigmatella aurantiaca]ADO70994.1 Transcriptional regulator, AraC family [Stigmatella aurantiaca DW4/3-1]EAU62012.1 transcriptional regulator, AraC family [Stigmatella aurantiaca DW4/3-1]